MRPDEFKGYIEGPLSSGVWSGAAGRVARARVRRRIHRAERLPAAETRNRAVTAVRRFETSPGRQAQVDSAHLGPLKIRGKENKPSGFTFALGYSRIMMMEQRWTRNWALCCDPEEAFRQLGGVPGRDFV